MSVDPAERALLAAIDAAPADDGPRLVYADLLMERQDPRGDFIRLQCEAASHPDPLKRREFERRAGMLLLAHRKAWSPGGFEWKFVRGFPSSVKVAASALFEVAPQLRAVSTFDGVELNFHGFTDALARAWVRRLSDPVFERLKSLKLTWYCPQEVPMALVEQPWVERLRALQISWVTLQDPGWKALGACAALRGLETLDLGLSGATDEAVGYLSEQAWPRLTSVRLPNNRLGTQACVLLTNAERWPAVKHLDLSWNRLGGKGGGALATATGLMSRLVSLDLSHTQVGNPFCVHLARANPPALESLAIEKTAVTHEGLAALRLALPKLAIKS